MSQLYSRQFFEAPSFSGAATTFYVVPAGYLAVVRCITIVHGDVLGSGLDAWVQTDSLTKLVRSTINIGLSPQPNWYGGTDLYAGWWAVNAGEELQCQTAAGTVDIYCSGHLLTLP